MALASFRFLGDRQTLIRQALLSRNQKQPPGFLCDVKITLRIQNSVYRLRKKVCFYLFFERFSVCTMPTVTADHVNDTITYTITPPTYLPTYLPI